LILCAEGEEVREVDEAFHAVGEVEPASDRENQGGYLHAAKRRPLCH